MYILKTEAAFDSAHFLYGYEGKCRNIHGHRWKIEAEICAEELVSEGQTRGMIVDFGDFKKDLKEIADSFDHRLIYEMGTLKAATEQALADEGFAVVRVDFRPTAENFSRHIFGLLKDEGYSVKRVTVYETPSNCAVYEED
ncbi:MAG: 6-carboxytetrahydropterin synthase QueD [Huintestinicola sp.]|uniref:6-carboxytetrahydropterin synthase QueD n=1 Tax=Huintestinicola sp. TaxID=2981661 RepID=UPI003F0853FC